jgi:hypothetical protein
MKKQELLLGSAKKTDALARASLWVLNLYFGNDSGRLLAGLPIIIFLAYDLWYRLLTRKKPYHHPKRWPLGLIVYLALLFMGSIGLNWYGYLISRALTLCTRLSHAACAMAESFIKLQDYNRFFEDGKTRCLRA